MTAKPKARSKCKHPRLSRESVCYDCGAFVDLTEKKHKYGAEKTVVDGVTFASKKEAARYDYLKTMFFYGKIGSLELQPSYRLEVNGELICIYKGDFRYVDLSNFKTIVEDAKGFKTPAYKLKKKLMKAIHGIEICEV